MIDTEPCPICGGTGKVPNDNPGNFEHPTMTCPRCHGSGVLAVDPPPPTRATMTTRNLADRLAGLDQSSPVAVFVNGHWYDAVGVELVKNQNGGEVTAIIVMLDVRNS